MSGRATLLWLAVAGACLARTGRAVAEEPASCHTLFGAGEHFVYRIDYLGLTAGRVEITLGNAAQRDGHTVVPIVAVAESRAAFSIFPVHDKLVSFLDLNSLSTVEDNLQAQEGTRAWRQRMRFDQGQGKLLIHRERPKDGTTDELTLPLAGGAVDVAGLFFNLRSQRFQAGSGFTVPVTTDTKGFTLKGAVGEPLSVKTDSGHIDVFPTALETRFSGKLETKRALDVLYTADEHRLPVRATAEFMLGTITATLSEYQPGTPFVIPCPAPEKPTTAQ